MPECLKGILIFFQPTSFLIFILPQVAPNWWLGLAVSGIEPEGKWEPARTSKPPIRLQTTNQRFPLFFLFSLISFVSFVFFDFLCFLCFLCFPLFSLFSFGFPCFPLVSFVVALVFL